MQQGVSSGRASSTNTHWSKWIEFTDLLGIDPLLKTIKDKVPILQVFLRRVRTGRLAQNKHPIQSRSAEDYVRSVAQTFLSLGAPDPRLNSNGDTDFRLTRQLKCYSKADPPPNRVKPVPIMVIRHILQIAHSGNSTFQQGVADMICLAFFFLLRPGEYTISPSDSEPFRLRNIQLFQGQTRLNLQNATDAQLLTATFGTLEFENQKNAVRGEIIGLAPSGNPIVCPTRALARRVIHLRSHQATPDTPLATVFNDPQGSSAVKPSHITQAIHLAVTYLGPSLGFLPSDVSARCLRASGANALLCANVDTDIIRLPGRWRSDEMLRYLHTQAGPVMQNFAQKMLEGGNFTLVPNQTVPSF